MTMTRTTITRITRIVFLVWLIVTAILLWRAAHRPTPSVARHEIEARNEQDQIYFSAPGELDSRARYHLGESCWRTA